MSKRYMSIWFPYLKTDWLTVRNPQLKACPVVFADKDHGRLIITTTNTEAAKYGIASGMNAADAKAIVTGLQVFDEIPGKAAQLLNAIGEWAIRFTPVVAVDLPDGLILDISGCTHLWGGEKLYMNDICTRLRNRGYETRTAIADTVGLAWGVARFGRNSTIINSDSHLYTLLALPPQALRLDPAIVERLHKLGIRKAEDFMKIKRSALRRRFGAAMLQQIDYATGAETETITPLKPVSPYEERLPCIDPIRTAPGIAIAIQSLLNTLCKRIRKEGVGIRTAILKCYRTDHHTPQISIGTSRATQNEQHLFRLFELKIANISPGLGIELFTLEATKTEEVNANQETIWATESANLRSKVVAELIDRINGKIPGASIGRYLPQEHYWPERSIKKTTSLSEEPTTTWASKRPRPTQLLQTPEPIEVSVPVPDYPPMLFIYKNVLHNIKKADGPERIEREWWLEDGDLRDYYTVEDEHGQRYWLFRSGSYQPGLPGKWFIHGFFA